MISDQTRRKKSREVSSRYLSTTVAPSSPPPPPPLTQNHILSPNRNNPKPKQKHKHTGFIRGLWPSSTSKSDNDHNQNPSHSHLNSTGAASKATSLADHLGNERRKDGVKRSENSPFLSKQKSCSEFRRSEKNSKTKNNLKEDKHYHYNHTYTPVFGGRSSMGFTGKLMFPGRSSISSSKPSEVFDSDQVILPGRLSVDENALRNRSSPYYQMKSDSFSDNSESSDVCSPFTTGRNSPASYMASTISCSKRSGNDNVRSNYINSPSSIPLYNSPKSSTLKNTMIKRGNSMASSPSEWESSPSRLGSPLYSSSKPPTSISRKNILHIGLDLIKGKKVGSKLHSGSVADAGMNMESVHQLRLLQSSWVQWRFANARAQFVNDNLAAQSKSKLLCGYESVVKLQESVVQKRMQLQKEKQELKLNLILHSQIKMLEAWGDIERRHILNVSVMKDYLHAVVCMLPLVQGAKADLESTTTALQNTSDLVATIKFMLSSVSPRAHENMVTLSELAQVVTQEKLLLEECFEHLRIITTLEIQERNLRCNILAMDSSAEHGQQKQ